ncbi:alpha/beta fold hydrolase [Antrihabitans cavernicola]|nr:alpha/beta hydrolase [Spelaeibacter cavernicola]
MADDGIRLAATELGPADAPLTVVFAHGYCLGSAAWVPQWTALRQAFGRRVRLVFFDQRGHGRSEVGPSESCTITQLGTDLDSVLRVLVPVGPVVLVGHSMGAMGVLSFARQHPEFVEDRVSGVALLSTAAHGLTARGLGRLLRTPLPDVLRAATRHAPGMTKTLRRSARRLLAPFIAAACTGTQPVSRDLAVLTDQLINDTDIATVAAFMREFALLDERAGLDVLATVRVPVLVMGGDADRVTPIARSVDIVDRVPHAEFVRIPGAGHMICLEHPIAVAEELRAWTDEGLASVIGRGYDRLG